VRASAAHSTSCVPVRLRLDSASFGRVPIRRTSGGIRGAPDDVKWLNYHHLLYFWTVAKNGSIAAASRELRLSVSAVSAQVRELERALGQPLFVRAGRRLVLTEVGEVACRFADDIFRLGRELQVVVRETPLGKSMRLAVGIVDDFPPLFAERLLRLAFAAVPGLHVSCSRGAVRPLLAELAAHDLDLVFTTEPVGDRLRGRARETQLGECGVTFFGAGRLAELRRGFPRSLDRAPVLLPAESSALRADLDTWFRAQGVRPVVVGDFADQALLRTFAWRGEGFFAGASVVEEEIVRAVGVAVLGRTKDVALRFYAVSMERRSPHPAVAAILEGPRVDTLT
jgi:LysR family transcriptional activator of nhaA